ncbi:MULTISPECIES: hybrid sensor histidine kinase/response regulator [unclassified Fibrobacter]|uniref:hybrid sensor histidine kinase/response regulator n=1 Tax=unclassified Fibrobacter TaxID=2634177 RepID=UPI000D6C91F5|nr:MULTISPECIES: hybrid sensor histidine kinase/response regulator [unclassified Fibrobacter]PWJ61588.1 Hpt domain-containing protein [Fibrobacter sp. UWR4]PZW74014.1 Hpt domain-containing protein [Fibrobacter sp. UWR1]
MSKNESRNKQSKYLWQYILTLVLTLTALIVIVYFTFNSFFKVTKENVVTIGENSVSESAANLNNFLLKSMDVLIVTSQIVDYMMLNGASSKELERLLVDENRRYIRFLDSSFTGVYGLFNGVYLDGSGWVPEEGYVPESRPWYKDAIAADGNVALVPPYFDAKERKIIISVSQMLSDKKSVVSFDIMLDIAQEMVNNVNVDGSIGSMMVFNHSGLVVAHPDTLEKGKNYMDEEFSGSEKQELLKRLYDSKSKSFEMEISGQACMVFYSVVKDDWYVVTIVNESELFRNVQKILYRNILISLILFALLLYFCTSSYRNRIIALSSSAAKSQFLANMSHEIRTPINGILGMNAMLLKKVTDESMKECAQNIDSAGHTLLSIVNDVLDISKIESGKMEILPVPYEMFSVLNDCYNMVHDRANEKALDLELRVNPNLPSGLLGDEIRIRQIGNNLLSNAVKYTDKGKVTLIVDFEKSGEVAEKSTITLIIRVADTGQGIRKEHLDKLFEKFERVNERSNRAIEGTGLGLNITKRLVEMMGGEISVESEFGRGSVFSVKIPQVVENVAPMGDFATRHKQALSKTENFKSGFTAKDARVLVVDDVKMNLRVVEGLLKDTQIQLDTATSGKDALAKVTKTRYDIILLDHMMPEMDGIETFAAMQKMDDNLSNGTPVIMLSANAIIGAKENYLKHGFTDYLSKPVSEKALHSMILKYLPHHMVRKSGEAATPEPLVAESVAPAVNKNPLTFMESMKGIPEIDVKQGLAYCAESEDFYQEMVEEYLKSNPVSELQKFLDAGDCANYRIVVHALKSSSRTIGAEKLAKMAENQERAAAAGNLAEVQENHGALALAYKSLVEKFVYFTRKL